MVKELAKDIVIKIFYDSQIPIKEHKTHFKN